MQGDGDEGEWVVINGVRMYKASVTIEVSRPKSSWQQQRVISYLAKMYPNGVPDECATWASVIQPSRGWTGRRCNVPSRHAKRASPTAISGIMS